MYEMSMTKDEHFFSNYKGRHSIFSFDFGVPLEDIFAGNDIHPRLKFLLEQAYKQSRTRNFNTNQLLRGFPDVSLEECFKLKEIIIYKPHYANFQHEPPETYFWLIRHFLGLLPISLLPKYAGGVVFDWQKLARSCHNLLGHHRRDQDRKLSLDYRIVKYLNRLPPEHLLMFRHLITFIRKVSHSFVKPSWLKRKALLSLLKYYCGAMFMRPYRPGYEEIKDTELMYFLLYVSVRWHNIEKDLNKPGVRSARNEWQKYYLASLKTEPIQPDCIVCKIYLKDGHSQTTKHSVLPRPSKATVLTTEAVVHNSFLGNSDRNENISCKKIDFMPRNTIHNITDSVKCANVENRECDNTEHEDKFKSQQNEVTASSVKCGNVENRKCDNTEHEDKFKSQQNEITTSNEECGSIKDRECDNTEHEDKSESQQNEITASSVECGNVKDRDCDNTEHEDKSNSQQNEITTSPIEVVVDVKSTDEVDTDSEITDTPIEVVKDTQDENTNDEDEGHRICFPSSLDNSNQVGWEDIRKETIATVKKVDGYTYDDYVIYKKGGSRNKCCKFNVWSKSTPKKCSCHRTEKNAVNSNIFPDINQSYLKYPDVFTEETESVENILGPVEGSCPGTCRSYNGQNSYDCLCSSRVTAFPDPKKKANKNRTGFSLKRFKMRFHFLRIFSSNDSPSSSDISNSPRNVKYKKIDWSKCFSV